MDSPVFMLKYRKQKTIYAETRKDVLRYEFGSVIIIYEQDNRKGYGFCMNKKLILVAAPPACGKTFLSLQIAKALPHIVYLDKDDLEALVRASFSAAGKDVDMDGIFYKENIRAAEYETLMHIALSTLRFEDYVLVNAPLSKEVRDITYMQNLKAKANECGAQLLLLWVTAPQEICFERMKVRNSERDTLKLLNWEEYVNKIDYTPPYALEQAKAVDGIMVFDNGNEVSFVHSLKKALNWIKGSIHNS